MEKQNSRSQDRLELNLESGNRRALADVQLLAKKRKNSEALTFRGVSSVGPLPKLPERESEATRRSVS